MLETLPGISSDLQEEELVQEQIIQVLYKIIFADIVEQLTQDSKNKKILNSADALTEAIKQGKIFYQNGVFYGSFNAKISKTLKDIGAKYNGRTKTFTLEIYKVPSYISGAMAEKTMQSKALVDNIYTKLYEVDIDKVLEDVDFVKEYEKATKSIDLQIGQNVVKGVGIKPQFTPIIRERIAKEYSNNLKIYIKDFAEKEILTLRENVYNNTFGGYRAEALIPILQERYDVSKNKARFLAKQEMSLLTSKYTESRYTELGIEEFVWSTSQDGRVREEHKTLNGRKFRFDNLPIIDERTGQRGLPGEAFGCRCVMKPVIKV